jgi:putative transposase
MFEHDIKISMHPNGISSLLLRADGKGRSIDNICIERFWRTIKYEEIYLNDYNSMSELRYSIDNYIVKYNSRRLHSAIGNKIPNEVYDTFMNNLEFKKQELLEVA